jgi:hypothetical protein
MKTQSALWLRDKRLPGTLSVVLVLLILLAVTQPFIASAFSGFGGYISEKLLGDGTDETMYLGDGTNDLTVLGTAPVVSTGTATSSLASNVISMTMTGDLHDLNGMPSASVWFQWTYNESRVMTFSTTQVTVTSTGEQTAIINPDADSTVYYRFVARTDGIAYGSTRSLSTVGGGHVVSHWMLNTLLPIVIAVVILVLVLMMTGNPIIALVAGVVGLAGFYIVLALVSSF